MGGKSAPPPPDYKAAAEASGQASRDVTESQTWANRPNQVTPWGKITWNPEMTYDPTTGQNVNKWTQITELDPRLQEALDKQLNLQNQRSDLAGSLWGRAEEEYSKPMDWSGLPDYAETPEWERGQGLSLDRLGDVSDIRDKSETALYNRMTSRLDPQWQQREEDTRARLIAQGLRPGDAAYDRAMENLGRQREDAYQTAMTESIMGGGQEAQRELGMMLGAGSYDRDAAIREWQANRELADKGFQAGMQSAEYQNNLRRAQLAEEMQKRGFSLNEINALIHGQQVGMPQMPEFSQATKARGTDYLGAAQNQYNSDLDAFSIGQAQNQGFLSGLGNFASAFMFSDRRLKKNIKKIGEINGVNIYEFDYLWGGHTVGVMADEVPHAAVQHPSGYLMVDYRKVLK